MFWAAYLSVAVSLPQLKLQGLPSAGCGKVPCTTISPTLVPTVIHTSAVLPATLAAAL